MDCKEVNQKLMELPVERFSELESHLSRCAECRRKAEAIKETEAEHRRILEEDARRSPPELDENGQPLPEYVPRLQGLAGFSHAGLTATKKGAFYKPFTLTLVIAAVLLVIFGPRVFREKSITDQAPKPTAAQVLAVLGGTPTDLSAPTAPARITIVPIIVQEGRKIRAPTSIPPRTSVWFGLSSTQHANVDLCMSWPESIQPIWSGYLKTGRVDVPEEGYVMDITGRYTFSISRAGDGSCKDPEGEVTLEVLP